MSFYDAHNHLQDERLARAIEALPEMGLRGCVVNGTCEGDWGRVSELAKRHSWVVPAFGLHPWFAAERSGKWFDTLRWFLDEHPLACVGEIGLDRWMRDPDLADQEKVFVQQLELAAERNMAASIHCLKAWGALDEMLTNHRRPARGFLIHSYGGSEEMVGTFSKLGGYFSFSGYFANERKAAQREVFKTIPLERLLLETDAPDMLPPAELRKAPGEINDPRNIEGVYEFAAGLWGVPMKELTRQMEANFETLFLARSKGSG